MDSSSEGPSLEQPSVQRMTRLRPLQQWLALVVLSLLFAGALELAALPAALLIGPMLAAILAGTNGATVRVPRALFGSAQAVVGCLVANSISVDIFPVFYAEWALFFGMVVATLTASSLLGWLISRWRILPGTTAVWGSSPGAATAMVLMAGAFGADQRLVAFMQYLRVIFVSVTAALVAKMWVDTSGVEVPPIIWFPPIDPLAFGATLGIAVVGGLLGKLLRLLSPFFLGTFIFGAVIHLGFSVPMQLPPWLLAVSYAMVGWSIGLNFTRPILRHAARALPQIIASIVALIAFCGGMAFVISGVLGIDPLTAYLATSPGGDDGGAVHAAAAQNVDISFVMALQSARFLVVLLVGPSVAKLVARNVRD
ncbi:AbrB family transcriptional regulator [Mesorhizobium sp. M1A.F.Ca.IN.020.32.1.1]|uniref:AbrB family transcriptional regulator n=1 Tax=Mesorhizobium sp. M1A.F.Ca.IN.020.32.1.1 TaxID=2496763 RepID=UPI000FD2A996|nr:AbrB family transcriptional regulator [Mesorhizobium sp. M1A.F.Ca.IN.020.32.1.1]RUV83472.1 AbrB family transcriptional regulator [Mesorhizobium sp. M1A.F.Ca.IN.020.32.1.1]